MLAPRLLQACMRRTRVAVDVIAVLLAFVVGLWAGTLSPWRAVRVELLLPDQHKFLLDIWLTRAVVPNVREAWEAVPHYVVVSLPTWPPALLLCVGGLGAMWWSRYTEP